MARDTEKHVPVTATTWTPASHDQAIGRMDREKRKPVTNADWIAEAADLLVQKGGVPADKAPSMAGDIFANTVAFFQGDEAKALASSVEEAVDSDMSYWDADEPAAR